MLDQYLSRYAEPESSLASALDESFEHVLAIPACDESLQGVLGAVAACGGAGVLSVVVVNGAPRHPPALHARNEALLKQLIERCGAAPFAPGAWLGRTQQARWLLIDRCSPERLLGRRHGVGLARRIAADVACALWQQDKLASPFIHMSDADARLPAGYFEAAREHREAAALTYPFRHRPCGDMALDRAHAIYELYLRYYVLGLRYVGSPYAFHTIGSTLAVDALAYARVRGMPRRQAAEDFYLLNKVAKLGSVVAPRCAPIALGARLSQRVPFGTGRAVEAIVSADHGWDSYHPDIFEVLKRWLDALARHCAEARPEQLVEQSLADAADALGAKLGDQLRAAVMQLDPSALSRALRGAPVAQRPARLKDWLDAFRTRKLVHALRDGGLGCLPWWQALSAPFCGLTLAQDTPTEALWHGCEQLAALELPAALPTVSS